MSTLLLHLSGNKTFNRTIFPPQLYIYDDLLLYKKRKLFSSKEITISYNQISQITLSKGIFFARLDVVTTGTEDIFIKFVDKKTAAQAKKIIDQKIYRSHAKHHEDIKGKSSSELNMEKSLSRLYELFIQGHMSEKDYKKKKDALLSNL
jgi:hypothetical protein